MTKDSRDEKQCTRVKTKISNLVYSYVNSYKSTLYALEKRRILKRLGRNKQIASLHLGKGNSCYIQR